VRILLFSFLVACGSGNAADDYNVGASCSTDADCLVEDSDTDPEFDMTCLTAFTGGYCGVDDCTANSDCPDGSSCVVHTDGTNYCFRDCVDKAECNENRGAEEESNCSANVDYVEEGTDGKACVPPSSGT